MKYIWRQISLGLAKESTRGTAVAPTIWTPHTTLDFDEKADTIVDESALGVKVKGSNVDVVRRVGRGSFESLLRVESIGLLLLNLLGKVTTSELDAGNAYSHLFEVENANISPSLTIGINEPNGDFNFPLAMVRSMTISAKIGEYVTVSVEFVSKKGESATHTATFASDDYNFTSANALFQMASAVAGLDGNAGVCIEECEITISKDVSEDYCLNGGSDLDDQTDGAIEISGSIVAKYNDNTTFKDVALAGTHKALSLKLEDSSIDLGGSNNPSIEFKMPKVGFTEYGRDKGNDNTITQNLTFMAVQDLTTWKAIDVTVVNGTTSY